jgi:protein-S-isoprenylcysteine O-methyltransferase Ste14
VIACALHVRIEVAHLAREFGARYDDFRHATPRWLVF